MMIDNPNLPPNWQISEVSRADRGVAVTLWHRPETGATAGMIWPTITGHGDSVANALVDANGLLTDLGRMWERLQR